MPDYRCGPISKAAHESHARVKFLWGVIGSAKSTWLCWRAFFKAVQASKSGVSLRAMILRDTYRNTVDSTLKTWLHWFPDKSMMGHISHSNPADYVLRTPDGRLHEVLFRHGQTAQDASMFLSTEYGFIGLEEVAPAYLPGDNQVVSPGIAEEVFDLCYSRLRQSGLDEPELSLTSNPPSRNHWASKRIIDKTGNERHGKLEFSLPGLPPVTWEHWFTPISENQENLRPGYYEELTATWPRILVRRFVEGERVDVFVGIPRFDLDALDLMKKQHAREPEFRGFLRGTDANILHVKLEANEKGYVSMWQPPKAGHAYIIGADSALGVEGGDYSAAFVLDRADLSIAAKWHGRCEPEEFGRELAKLGSTYGYALIGVESNFDTVPLITLRNLGYPRIFYQQNIETRNRRTERIGWRTDRRTKPILIDGIASYLEDGGVIVDAGLISELMTFGIDETGACQAQIGCHDDLVIAFGLALQMQRYSGLERIFPSLGKQEHHVSL